MSRLLIARVTLAIIGAGIWGYGRDNEQMRLVGMAVLVIALLLRFVPRGWLGDPPREP